MKIKITLLIIAVIVTCIAAWFTYTKYQLRNAEIALLEELKNPTGMIVFWSKSNKPILIKITNKKGEYVWVPLSPKSTIVRTFDAGDIKIERVFDEKVIDSFNLTLGIDAKVDFNVFDDRFERSQ